MSDDQLDFSVPQGSRNNADILLYRFRGGNQAQTTQTWLWRCPSDFPRKAVTLKSFKLKCLSPNLTYTSWTKWISKKSGKERDTRNSCREFQDDPSPPTFFFFSSCNPEVNLYHNQGSLVEGVTNRWSVAELSFGKKDWLNSSVSSLGSRFPLSAPASCSGKVSFEKCQSFGVLHGLYSGFLSIRGGAFAIVAAHVLCSVVWVMQLASGPSEYLKNPFKILWPSLWLRDPEVFCWLWILWHSQRTDTLLEKWSSLKTRWYHTPPDNDVCLVCTKQFVQLFVLW